MTEQSKHAEPKGKAAEPKTDKATDSTVEVRFDRASWGRKAGEVKNVDAATAERLTANGFVTRV